MKDGDSACARPPTSRPLTGGPAESTCLDDATIPVLTGERLSRCHRSTSTFHCRGLHHRSSRLRPRPTGDRRASVIARASSSASIDPVRFCGVGSASALRLPASIGAHAGQAGDRLAGDRTKLRGKTCWVELQLQQLPRSSSAVVRERLQPTLVRALTALISDLRPALDSTVRETIARAISPSSSVSARL